LRRIVLLLVLSLSLLVGLLVIFINLTEVDIVLRQSLRPLVPQGWQDALRPLRAPMVIGFAPDWEATDVALRSPVAITFLTRMDPSSTESSVHIEPAVNGRFSWRGGTLFFTPTEDWPMQTDVSVTVTREARSWLLRRMERGFTFHFTTLGAPFVVETEPVQDAMYTQVRDRLTITFSRPMDPRSVEVRLSISPEISGRTLAWNDQELTISGALEPSTDYRVVVRRGARDSVYEIETLQDFEWFFTTTERHPYLAVTRVGREVLVSADLLAELQLEMVNVSRVDLDLYSIDVSTYISMTNFSLEDWRRFEPGVEPLRSWSMNPEVALDRDERRIVEIQELEPGLYFLTAQSPEGAQDSQILVSTHTALALKRASRQVLVWATSLHDGHPSVGASLTVYNAVGDIVATGLTDEEGIFSTEIPDTGRGLNVVAQKDDDVSVCSDAWRDGIEPWRFEEVLWGREASADGHELFVYTDRPLYRPGESASFRAVVRVHDNGGYSLPRVGTPVEVTVGDYRGIVLYEEVLHTNTFGTVNGSVELNNEVARGEYFIEARVEDEEHRTAFQVEEYREPAFAVKVDAGRDQYVNGDVITATIMADYIFGVPVVGAAVRYTLYSHGYDFPWRSEGDGFGALSSIPYGEDRHEVASGEGFTDEKGALELVLRADVTREERSQVFTLEAIVTDDAGDQVSSATTFLVHRGEFDIGLEPERYVVSRGERTTIDVGTVAVNGEPVGDLDLTYVVYLVEWREIRRQEEGRAYWDWQEVVSEVEASSIRTDGDGQGRIAFVAPRGGLYRLRVQGRDERGNRVLARLNLWVSDVERHVAWRYQEHDRIRLVADEDSYSPGDVARILVQSPYDQATALVTVERGRIVSQELMEMDGNSTVVELPVEREYSPNVFVSVVLAPSGTSAETAPSFKLGYAELRVESVEDELRLSVVPDRREYRPSEMATYTIRARDHLNRPVSAEVSLGVVDASMSALAGDATPDVVDAFYGRRRLGVRTAHSLTIHVDRERPTEDYGPGAGLGEQEPDRVFADVAYWNPAVVTDENGVARVEFQMPAKVTTWRAFAQGVTLDTRVGAASEDVVASRDLTLRPLLPRFLSVGDQAVIGALMENHADDALEVRASVTATNVLLPPGLAHSVAISQNHSVRIRWRVEASQAPSATITMIADAPGMREVVQRTVPILPFGERKVLLDACTIDGDELRRVVNLPPGAQFPVLELDLSPSLPAALVGSLDYLTDYPYGCVEQTVSRLVPHVVVSQTLDGLDLDNDGLRAKLLGQVESSLQRLYRFQRLDGGWGWCKGEESEPYQTAYVVYGLTQVERAGHEVNTEVLRRGVRFLQHSLLETRDLDLKAHISYVLAEYGEGDLSLARALSERRRGMDLYAQAYLALALGTLGDSQGAKVIVDDLVTEVVETAHTAHWGEGTHDLAVMSSDGRTTALILRAMLAVDPDHPLIPKTVQWFMWTRSGGYWRTTQETAAVIMALTEYLAAKGVPESHFTYQVFLNGQQVAEAVVTPDNVTEHREIKYTDLIPGDNEITVLKEGEGQLGLATAFRYYGEKDGLEPAWSLKGPAVERQYEHPESGELLTSCHVGDLIRVRLKVHLPEDMWHIMVEDPLPAGAQGVEGTSSMIAAGEAADPHYSVYPEFQDAKVVFFTNHLREGIYEYSYLMRATMAGSFRAMPTEVIAMYDPDVWGRSRSAVLRIEG